MVGRKARKKHTKKTLKKFRGTRCFICGRPTKYHHLYCQEHYRK